MSHTSSPRDFSLFSLFAAGLACIVPFASAYTQPVGASPEGNAFSEPGLNSVVPAGESFAVTWEPTTDGTVTLVLLKGPSTDAEPQYAIAEGIKNSGTYLWTPSTSLEPTSDAEGYGIQLIVDATGQYQYTTQFGISNADYVASSSSSSSAAVTASSSAWAVSTSSSWGAAWPVTTSATSSKVSSNTTTTIGTAPIGTGASSGLPHNVTMVSYTGAMTVPTSLLTSATTTSAASTASAPAATTTHKAAAAAVRTSFAGLVVAGAMAVFVL